MKELSESRRKFLKAASLTTGAIFLSSAKPLAESGKSPQTSETPAAFVFGSADYTLQHKTSPCKVAWH